MKGSMEESDTGFVLKIPGVPVRFTFSPARVIDWEGFAGSKPTPFVVWNFLRMV
jgi:hypothetical protein